MMRNCDSRMHEFNDDDPGTTHSIITRLGDDGWEQTVQWMCGPCAERSEDLSFADYFEFAATDLAKTDKPTDSETP